MTRTLRRGLAAATLLAAPLALVVAGGTPASADDYCYDPYGNHVVQIAADGSYTVYGYDNYGHWWQEPGINADLYCGW